jgi:hypothetical protein
MGNRRLQFCVGGDYRCAVDRPVRWGGQRVFGDARSEEICAGWLPQDGLFGWNGSAV